MYTGIVQGQGKVVCIQPAPGLIHYGVQFPSHLLPGLELGASVSVDGTCQTVVKMTGDTVWFDAIQETLAKTTLHALEVDQLVNLERSAKFGDEIGGHVLAGHIFGTTRIKKIEISENNHLMILKVPEEWLKYFFPKGFVALNGVSLTIGQVYADGRFTVHLIPETLRRTNLSAKREGDLLNLELDSQTQMIVDTIDRRLAEKFGSR